MSTLFELGIEIGHIALDADQNNIVYTAQGKRLRYSDPEQISPPQHRVADSLETTAIRSRIHSDNSPT